MVVAADPITSDDLVTPLQQLASSVQVLVAPTARVVTADQLRSHCRTDDRTGDGEGDDFLNLFIDAATEHAEASMACSLMPRTLRAVFNAGEPIDLPFGPVIQLLQVAGSGQSPTTAYTLRNFGWTVRVEPTGSINYPAFVNYRAGYTATDGTSAAVPSDIKLAILMHAATLYANRETVSDKSMVEVPHTLEAFYARKRRFVGVR